MTSDRRRRELIDAVRRGEAIPRASVSEPHWYLILVDRGCVLCGKGEDTRVRMPGTPPTNRRDRYLDVRADYACGSHFC